jgi:cell division protein FtsZ
MAVGLLGAPVPADVGEPETAEPEPSGNDAVMSGDASYSSASYSSISRPAHAELGKTFDVASTRRRPVVFEEDDDLDVPDFLK